MPTEHAIYWLFQHELWDENPAAVIASATRYERRILAGRAVRRSGRREQWGTTYRLFRAVRP